MPLVRRESLLFIENLKNHRTVKHYFYFFLQWEELYRSKPDENYEDPEDVTAIKHAQMTVGDFKLKTAHDYVVPENERINAEKKRAQLFDLQEEVC